MYVRGSYFAQLPRNWRENATTSEYIEEERQKDWLPEKVAPHAQAPAARRLLLSNAPADMRNFSKNAILSRHAHRDIYVCFTTCMMP